MSGKPTIIIKVNNEDTWSMGNMISCTITGFSKNTANTIPSQKKEGTAISINPALVANVVGFIVISFIVFVFLIRCINCYKKINDRHADKIGEEIGQRITRWVWMPVDRFEKHHRNNSMQNGDEPPCRMNRNANPTLFLKPCHDK